MTFIGKKMRQKDVMAERWRQKIPFFSGLNDWNLELCFSRHFSLAEIAVGHTFALFLRTSTNQIRRKKEMSMKKTNLLALTMATCALALAVSSASAQDWPQWRGPA